MQVKVIVKGCLYRDPFDNELFWNWEQYCTCPHCPSKASLLMNEDRIAFLLKYQKTYFRQGLVLKLKTKSVHRSLPSKQGGNILSGCYRREMWVLRKGSGIRKLTSWHYSRCMVRDVRPVAPSLDVCGHSPPQTAHGHQGSNCTTSKAMTTCTAQKKERNAALTTEKQHNPLERSGPKWRETPRPRDPSRSDSLAPIFPHKRRKCPA